MPLDDRLHQTIEAALAGVRTHLESTLGALLDELRRETGQAQARAVAEARQQAQARGDEQAAAAVKAAEARGREALDRAVEETRAEARAQAAIDVRRLIEAETEQRHRDTMAATEQRHALAMADLQARAQADAKSSVAEARVQEREAELAALTRLVESIRGLDGAASLSEVLDALALAASREAARSAVFVMRGDRLVGWKLAGFGARDASPKLIDLTLAEAGVIGHAVSASRSVTTRDGHAAVEGPGFTTLPPDRVGLAVPVIVGGRVVAAVYADSFGHDGRDRTVPGGWPEVIEVLARHAARCLEALTSQRAASAPSPRFWVPPGGKTAGGAARDAGPGAPPLPGAGA